MIRVVDASVALKWVIPESDSPLAHGIRRSGEFIAPDLLVSECVNAIWKRARREGYAEDERNEAIQLVVHLKIDLVPTRDLAVRAGALAQALDHPAYDCFYLALAERSGAPLLTADDRLTAKLKSLPGVTAAGVESLQSFEPHGDRDQ